MSRIVKYKWWFAWECEKIENWLEGMEKEGFHVVDAGVSGLRFVFEKGTPRIMRYCADYQNKKTEEYISIFEDMGWELVYSGMGWYIWRTPYEGERPDIYSDTTSLIQRNKRVSLVLIIAGLANVPNVINMFSMSHSSHSARVLLFVQGVLFTLISFGLYKLYNHNKELENKKL